MLPVAVANADFSSVKRNLGGGDEGNKQFHGTSICLADRKRHGNIDRMLVEHGFDVNHEDAKGHTAVHSSVTHNYLESVELHLQNGANSSVLHSLAETKDMYDLIFSAARKGFGNIVKVLLDFGTDINAKDEYSQTLLHHAILQDSAVFTFLKESVKINTRAMETVVDLLLTKGADVNAKTLDGFSPLHFAIKLKYASIVSTLVKHGADFHSLVNFDIRSPKLSEFHRKSNPLGALALGGRIVKPRLTTVLHIAADSNDVASLKCLISAGAPVDSVQHDGTTPLIVAIKREYGAMVKVLLDSGADVEQKGKYGLTPLHVACRRNAVNVLNSLLAAGANVNATCDNGKVPFQYVLQHESEMKDEYYSQEYYSNAMRSSSSSEMKEILQNHIVLMYIIGYYLHDYNKQIAMNVPSYFCCATKIKIEDFLKNVIIRNDVTLYRLIDEVKNPVYLRNPNALKGLDQAVVVADAKYPGLGNVVKFLVRSARSRANQINTGIEWFIKLNRKSHQLPPLTVQVLEILLSFLFNEEIQGFINCCDEILSCITD